MPAVRVGRASDLEALEKIARLAKASWGYPPHWIEQWADDLRADPAAVATGNVLVAEVAGLPVGWTALGGRPGRREITHLWVDPASQGRGVGRRLVKAVVDEAARRGWRRLTVESDPHAAQFYEALGARRVGRVHAPMDGVERWLPVLELSTGVGTVRGLPIPPTNPPEPP